jgi:adenylate cyclase
LTDLRQKTLIFSDYFDGSFENVFQHKSNLIDRISTSAFRNTERSEVHRAEQAPTDHIGAYEWYLRGLASHRRAGISPDNARQAFDQFTNAIDIDSDFDRAYAWRIGTVGWYAPEYFEDPGLAETRHALSIDEHDAEVQRIAAYLLLYRGDYEDGLKHIEKAVDLNPSDAYLLAGSAIFWAYYGEPENGLKYIERAMMLDPFLPVWCVEDHGVVLYSMDAFPEAVRSLQRLSLPTTRSLSFLAASLVAMGELGEAKAVIQKLSHLSREYRIEDLMMTSYYRHDRVSSLLVDRLQAAGLD